MHSSRLAAFAIFVSAATLLVSPSSAQDTAASTPDYFETKVRPVLAGSCYSCHTNSQMGGLRVDSLEALQKGGKRGPAIVAGDPDKSLLIVAVKQSDPTLKMPMGGKLKESEIAALSAWVKAGAKWPKNAAPISTNENGKYTIQPEQRKFWSFQPLLNPPAPAVKDAKWSRTEIDRFVLSRLEKEGLHPVRPASKRDLIRRATLDLTGLPPTPEEMAAFEKDASPEAFAKVVDRLLASPHYGERWGRIWLDVARYGEDDYRSLDPMGRGLNPYPNAFAYRDWVIKAFNDDLPYDQFVKAQLAGDLMDPKTRYRTLPAVGFLGLGPWYYDNGSTEVTRADERHDRVDVVTRGFLGLTVACARCHDHKYDPIPASDYYALSGVFYNTLYEDYPQAPKAVLAKFQVIENERDEKQDMLKEMQSDLGAQLSRSLAFQTANYLQGVFELNAPGKDKKEVDAIVDARKLDYELFQRWISYMGKVTDKYHEKDEWQAMVKKGGTPEEAKTLAEKFQERVVAVMLAKASLDKENKVILAKSIEGTKKKKRTNKPSNFVTNDDFCPDCAVRLKSLSFEDNSFWTEVFQRELVDGDDPAVMMGKRLGKPGVLMFRGWGLESRVGAEHQARLKTVQNDIDEANKKMEPYYPYLHGVKDSERPANIQLALRGNPYSLGAEVPRHFLSILSGGDPAPFTKGSGRLELADEIVRQPIAMRVLVNRVWRSHFGTGIVDSPSNFGFGGERPSDPELLEYLASSFKQDGMSIKKLHRRIMMSAVYQLGTEMDKTAFDKDSGNRLYWRMNRHRMDAEQIRDSILAVSGNLDQAVGGPSEDLTPAFLRRTVYGKVSRYKLDAYLQIFDFPSPAISAEKRFNTTVPLQRLFLMNSDFMQLEAEELARRVGSEPDNIARIRKLYELLYGRQPREDEIALGIEYLHSEPMREFDEEKAKPADGKPADGKNADGKSDPGSVSKGGGGDAPVTLTDAAKPAPSEATKAIDAKPVEAPAATNAAMGMGMMSGLGEHGAGPVEVKYEATPWGRYAKALLSSTEFIFIN